MGNSNNKGVDRITLLPDHLLHDILSFLDTMQVVQTCVLSKRWKTLWTHVPTLNFDFDSIPIQVVLRVRIHDARWLNGPELYNFPATWKDIWFKRFFFEVLSNHRSECIQKLSYTHSEFDTEGFLKKILSYPPCHRAQELYITTNDMDESTWSCLSAFKLLTILKITCGKLNNLGSLVLPRLRILEIKRLLLHSWDEQDFIEYYNDNLEDEYYNKLEYYGDVPLNEKTFSGCPNLGCLVLIDCLFVSACISAPKLESLELRSTRSRPFYPEVELCTPNLKSLKLSNVVPCVKSASDLLYIDKLTLAIIGLNDDYEFEREKISQLLRVFHNAVVSLTLPENAIQVIFKHPSLSGRSFHNLRHLKEFKTLSWEEIIEVPVDPNTISKFIDCPNLQTSAVHSTITSSFNQLSLQDDEF